MTGLDVVCQVSIESRWCSRLLLKLRHVVGNELGSLVNAEPDGVGFGSNIDLFVLRLTLEAARSTTVGREVDRLIVAQPDARLQGLRSRSRLLHALSW